MDKADKKEDLQGRLLHHLGNRRQLRELLESKNIALLKKTEMLIDEMPEPEFEEPAEELQFELITKELRKYNFNKFRYLGSGITGFVLLAKNGQTHVRYAIKSISVRDRNGKIKPDKYKQCEQEIHMLKKISGSPYTVNLIDIIDKKENQYCYLLLTECQGTLQEIIDSQQDKQLNELSTIKYAKDIAEGLHYVHSQGCVIADIKMENILIDYNGNAVISDFGFAQNYTKKTGYAQYNYKGNFLYQAPECYDSSRDERYFNEYKPLKYEPSGKPSERSDAFSFGLLIFAMIYGETALFLKEGEKHLPFKFKPKIESFRYKNELKQVMTGLTQFLPKERLLISVALDVLRQIIAIEFKFEGEFNEVMINQNELNGQIKNDFEIIQQFSNQYYPIIKNTKDIEFSDLKGEEGINQLMNKLENCLTQNKTLCLEIERRECEINALRIQNSILYTSKNNSEINNNLISQIVQIKNSNEYQNLLLNKNRYRRIVSVEAYSLFMQTPLNYLAQKIEALEKSKTPLYFFKDTNFDEMFQKFQQCVNKNNIQFDKIILEKSYYAKISSKLKQNVFNTTDEDTIIKNILSLYESESDRFYSLVNSILNVLNDELNLIMEPLILCFYLAIKRLKKQEESLFIKSQFVTLYRGLSIYQESFELMNSKKEIILPSFSSFTAFKNDALFYIYVNHYQDTIPILIEAEFTRDQNLENNPKRLENYGIYDKEEEYLLPPNTIFKIQSFTESDNNGYRYYTLKVSHCQNNNVFSSNQQGSSLQLNLQQK